MKKYSFLPVIALVLFSVACNNSAGDTKKPARTQADTLYDEVMDGHDAGMGKMGALTRAEKEVSRLIDSIEKLPAKARELSSPYKARLNDLQAKLKDADSSMNKWMEDFNLDSAMNNTAERVRYLLSQKETVTKVKGMIQNSLQKADSVLKKNF